MDAGLTLQMGGERRISRARLATPSTHARRQRFRSVLPPIPALQLVALAITMALLATRLDLLRERELVACIAVGLGVVALRMATATRALPRFVMALDGIGMALLISGTGVGVSPFWPLVFAGTIWASSIPRRNAGTVYLAAFGLGAIVLVVPVAVYDGALTPAAALVFATVTLGAMSNLLVGHRRAARGMQQAVFDATLGPEEVAWRLDLAQRARELPTPIEVELAEGQSIPNAVQAAVLAYLLADYSQSSATSTPGATSDSKRAYSSSLMW